MKTEANKQRTDRLNKEALIAEKAAKKELDGVAVLYNEKPKDDGVTDHTPLYRHRSN